MTHAAESLCNNGGCTRPRYRGKECYRCWAGTKWTSIVLRLRNANGRCASYIGLPLGFTRETLIQWVFDNPPPEDMETPSIDRIKPELGYVPGNIRWLDRRKNSAGPNRDLPDELRRCAICKTVKPFYSFPIGSKDKRRSSYCKPCSREYQRNWEAQRDAR